MGRKLAKRICGVLADIQSAFDSEDPDDEWKLIAVDVGCVIAVVGLFAVSQLSLNWYSDGIGMVEQVFIIIGGEIAVITAGFLAGALMYRKGKQRNGKKG